MKSKILTTIALGAALVLAAARPASAESLFSPVTLADIDGCFSSNLYALDELHACERAFDDLNAQSNVTTNWVDHQNVDLEMANVGVMQGLLSQQLGIDGSGEMFTAARSLLQAVHDNAVSAEIADRANSLLAMMDKDGI